MLTRRRIIGGVSCLLLASSMAACDKVAAAFAKAGQVAEMVRKWIMLLESAVPALGLEGEEAITVAKTIEGAKDALEAVEALGRAGKEQQKGELEAAKAELQAAYTKLYELANEVGLLSAAATVAAGPEAGERPGTPDELAQAMAE